MALTSLRSMLKIGGFLITLIAKSMLNVACGEACLLPEGSALGDQASARNRTDMIMVESLSAARIKSRYVTRNDVL
jgi:hypothetical protein